ncbi:asparaginase [Glaciihabitans sp. INWT7]|uniref:asparaginase n=1 Tax=Glaciihabitans sp. INWT7 TaxID=2596912 RepID=UPI001625B537|nr:asparaginase [Glaciihabitans sp. INWT7]QNE46455.1 asparaginase [Glaciihabitans sp. INWT7]
MSHPLDPTGVVELAILSRSGLDESRHLGAAVVVSPDGSVLRSLGDVDALVYGRSSLKFFQAIAVLRSGVSLAGAQLVLSTASHAGTAAHVEVVRSILERAGLDVEALQCPVDWPLDSASRSAASAPARITMNCSGKHAAFLLACVENGWDTASYLDPEHPLQQRIRATVEEFTGEPVGHIGVDGCGAPVFATTLRGLATAVGRVAASRDPSAALLTAAVLAEPWAIDGPGRANTVVIEQLGLLTKGGAEGVIVMGAPDGTAVALKMLDGSARATSLVGLGMLASVGAISLEDADRVGALTTERVLGGGLPVGAIRVSELVRGL